MGRMMAIGIVVAALVGAGAGFAGGYLSNSGPAAQSREFYLFTSILGFDEAEVGLPPDVFVPDRIVVNRGDHVTIHYYNTEPVASQEHHTFTMDGPYASIDHDINAGQNVTFTFDANTVGTFTYRCTYHVPSMTGTLTVLG